MRTIWIILLVIALLAVLFFVTKLLQSRPKALGVHNGRLLPCPDSPNCVSSIDTDSHAIAPIRHNQDKASAYRILRDIVLSQENVQLYEENPEQYYLRVEAITPRMRFVDDVEFLVEESSIQLRSASRFGYGDGGTNRKRIEQWRAPLEQALQTAQ